MAKPVQWQNPDGTKYQISYSEELQVKNLEATRRLTTWQRRNFALMLLLLLVIFVFAAAIIYTLAELDKINFFTRVAFR